MEFTHQARAWRPLGVRNLAAFGDGVAPTYSTGQDRGLALRIGLSGVITLAARYDPFLADLFRHGDAYWCPGWTASVASDWSGARRATNPRGMNRA